jgi:hypothetical protein
LEEVELEEAQVVQLVLKDQIQFFQQLHLQVEEVAQDLMQLLQDLQEVLEVEVELDQVELLEIQEEMQVQEIHHQ